MVVRPSMFRCWAREEEEAVPEMINRQHGSCSEGIR